MYAKLRMVCPKATSLEKIGFGSNNVILNKSEWWSFGNDKSETSGPQSIKGVSKLENCAHHQPLLILLSERGYMWAQIVLLQFKDPRFYQISTSLSTCGGVVVSQTRATVALLEFKLENENSIQCRDISAIRCK